MNSIQEITLEANDPNSKNNYSKLLIKKRSNDGIYFCQLSLRNNDTTNVLFELGNLIETEKYIEQYIKIFSDVLTFENYSTILTGHADLIKTLVQLEHDVLASDSWDSTIKLSNLTTMSLIKTLQNHTGSLNSLLKVKLDTGLTFLISGSQDSAVKVLNKFMVFINFPFYQMEI